MDKIYRRPTQSSGTEPKKRNQKKRFRNVFLNFRVTPLERNLIEARIAATGMTKSRFFIESCLYQAILVKGNIRTFTEMKKAISDIEDAISVNPDLSELDPELAMKFKTIIEILNSRFRREQ